MRLLPLTAASAIALAVLTAGCSTVNKVQACAESSQVVTETISKIGSVTNDPKEMEKALNDGAAKLGEAADKAGNTTINQALEDLSSTLGKINVRDANDAVDAAQKVTTDGAATVEKIAQECT